MNRLQGRLAACCAVVCSCVLSFAAEPPAPPALPAPAAKPAQSVPAFALAVLSFRALGNGLEKAGLYANQLLPNSSALAKQIAMSYLFSLPIDAGLQQGAPARVYALDPISTGLNSERALSLGIADAAAVKAALIGAYGAPAELDGVMTFTLPQPLPQPDKTLLIKFSGERLLAAPNAAVLAKLEEFEKTAPVLADGLDVVASVRVGAVRRAFGELVEMTADALIDLTPDEQAAQLRDMMKLFETLWQFDALDLALRIDAKGDTGELEVHAFPRPGSPVAAKMAQPGLTLSERTLRLIPEKSALYAAWVVNGAEVSKLLQEQSGKAAAGAPEALKPHAAAFEKALIDFVTAIQGEVALSLSGTDIRSPLLLASADVPDPEAGMARAGAALDALHALANAQLKLQLGAALNGGEALLLKKGQSDLGGVPVTTYEIAPAALSENERLDIAELMGWPPVVRACVIEKKLVLVLGRESADDLTALFARLKAPLNESDPALRAMKQAVAGGSQAVASLTALNAAKLILARTPLPPHTTLDRLMRGLSDAPAVLSGRALNQFSLRIHLPSGAAHAIGSIFQRVDKAMAAVAAEQPAPPPPPPAPAP